jgi:hypothetical protein
MGRIRRAHYGAVVGVALVAAALLVTATGKWQDVQYVLGAIGVVLSVLLTLKIVSVAVIIGLRSVL